MATVKLAQTATEQVLVTPTFDTNGNPTSAIGQKQLVDDGGNAVDDGEPNTLTIPSAAVTQYQSDLAAALQNFEAALVAANYPQGEFQAPAQS